MCVFLFSALIEGIRFELLRHMCAHIYIYMFVYIYIYIYTHVYMHVVTQVRSKVPMAGFSSRRYPPAECKEGLGQGPEDENGTTPR